MICNINVIQIFVKKNDGEELVPEKINVYIIKSLENMKN